MMIVYLVTTAVSWFCISLSFFRPHSVIGDAVIFAVFQQFSVHAKCRVVCFFVVCFFLIKFCKGKATVFA